VDATVPEAIEVAEFVSENFTEEEQAALAERIAKFQSAILKYYDFEVEKFRETCPFLVDQLCTVYQARPLSCRGLTSPDATLCERWERQEIPPPMPTPPIELTTSLTRGIVQGTYEAGFPSGYFELSGAVGSILQRGAAAYTREGTTAPVERFLTHSAIEDKDLVPSEALSHLMKQPRMLDIWEAGHQGDIDSVSFLLPKIQDRTITLIEALALPSLYESQDELEESWAGLLSAVAQFEDAKLDPVTAYERLPFLSTFHWAYTGKDVTDPLRRAMSKIHDEVVSPALPHLTMRLPDVRKPGKFRLGYMGSRHDNFSGSRWAIGWLANHSPEIETYAFNLNPLEDLYTNLWCRHSDHYFSLPIPPAIAAEFIRSMDLDALIFTDLGIGNYDSQLSSFRLARKQFTAWGHPVTSGSPAIDGYLSSVLMEPKNAQEHYTEELFLLPGSGLCYPRNIHLPLEIDPTRFGLPSTGFFFQAQMASKCLPKHDDLYRQITEASGKPIAFIEPLQDFNLQKFENRLRAAGVNAVIVPRLPTREYLGLMAKADTILDAPSWNGGNSTIDALSLSKPVVSIAGEFMRGRHSLAFLAQAGVSSLVAASSEDYVCLALNAEKQKDAMKSLETSRLFNDKTVVQALDQLLLSGFTR
jgi:hypothetical protein